MFALCRLLKSAFIKFDHRPFLRDSFCFLIRQDILIYCVFQGFSLHAFCVSRFLWGGGRVYITGVMSVMQ